MIYKEKNPLFIEAYKFTGEITDDLKKYNILAPNSLQAQYKCPVCGGPLENHGLFKVGNSLQAICPNNYIIIGKDKSIQLMSVENFEKIYIPILIEECNFSEK